MTIRLAEGAPEHELRLLALVLLLQQPLELLALILDPVRQPLLIRGARLRRRLFGELAKIVAQHRDAVGDLVIGKPAEIGHADQLPLTALRNLAEERRRIHSWKTRFRRIGDPPGSSAMPAPAPVLCVKRNTALVSGPHPAEPRSGVSKDGRTTRHSSTFPRRRSPGSL